MTSPAPDYGQGENKVPLTFEEAAVLRLLRQLAARWPASLTLAEADGVLRVVRTGDARYGVIATVEGILTQGMAAPQAALPEAPASSLARNPVSLADVDYTRYCWGDDLSQLPRTCLTGMPKTPEPAWGAPRMTCYEGLTGMQLGRGHRVPWHPSSCQAVVAGGEACGHAQVWHRGRTRTHPCEVAGCTCLGFVKMWPVPAMDPRGAA